MASSSSWFQRSPSRHNYELPRWHTASHMSASIIPPPIVQSTYNSSPKLTTALPTRSVVIERPTTSESRESALQADLQFLLDAQAEGLVRGLEGGQSHDGISSGSTTPTARSSRNGTARQINRPVRKKLGLRSARKGIYSCMLALTAIKDDELQAASQSLQEKEDTLAQINAWESKKAGLEVAASKVDSDEETIRVQRLQQEADVLQEEINKAEIHLLELRTRRRRVLKQATAVENTVQAKLASYTTSLNLLDNETRTFLNSRSGDARSESSAQSARQPATQKTLTWAKDQIHAEKDELKAQSHDVRLEKDALHEGTEIWKDVVERVTSYERRLRAEMSSLGSSMTDSTMAWDDTPRIPASERLTEIHKHIETLIEELEKRISLAEERNWRLLIAAIGAELDALRRGKEILDGLLGRHSETQQDQRSSDTKEPSSDDASIQTPDARYDQRHERARRRSDTDDEPDPELLFSVQDGDRDE